MNNSRVASLAVVAGQDDELIAMTGLEDYFDHEVDEESYSFTVSTLTPSCERQELVARLAEIISKAKSDPTVTADLIEAAGWTTAIADLRKGQIAVRRGDFAEAVAAEASEDIDGRKVPVRKLRYQIDPEQTLPGSDVVGFIVSEETGEIDTLEFMEVKYRTTPDANLAVDAHDQLADDYNTSYATTLKFLASRLKELDTHLYEEYLRFLRKREVKRSRHAIALSFDRANWLDSIAHNLNSLDEHLPALRLRLLPFTSATDLIDEVYDNLGWEVSDDA